MKAVVQRVFSANVQVDGEIVGRVEQGLVVFLGVETEDTHKDLDYICTKIVGMRIFDDNNEVPNLSVEDIRGSVLLISQFTLCGDTRHGRRPSYIGAAKADLAKSLFEKAVERIGLSVPVASGRFQANMRVYVENDGPFTILLESRRNT